MKRYFFGEGVYFFWKKEADIKDFFFPFNYGLQNSLWSVIFIFW